MDDNPMIPPSPAPNPWDRRLGLLLSLVFLGMGIRGCYGQREGLERMQRIEDANKDLREQNREIKALLEGKRDGEPRLREPR